MPTKAYVEWKVKQARADVAEQLARVRLAKARALLAEALYLRAHEPERYTAEA